MKYFLASLLFLPIFSAAQDTTSVTCKLTRETDPFTKQTKISTGFMQMDGASVTMDATKPEIDFLFFVEGADRCYDNNSTAVIFFEGTKAKLTIRNGGSMNCEGLFHFIFKNSPNPVSMLTKLSTMKMDNIVFTGNNKKEVKIELTEVEQQSFMTFAGCLLADAKTLLQ